MAVDVTRIYRKYQDDFDEEAAALLSSGFSCLSTQNTTFCRTVDDSKRLNNQRGPRIIISASGMCTGGRILHHLMNLLPRKDTTLLFVGYQAEGTRGRTIQSGATEVKMFGTLVPIRCHIENISALSAHADQAELLRWLSSAKSKPAEIKVVHGEPQAAETFAGLIREKLRLKASVAQDGEVVELS